VNVVQVLAIFLPTWCECILIVPVDFMQVSSVFFYRPGVNAIWFLQSTWCHAIRCPPVYML
jgi:hypothetical protein